jgi:CheY-like chemotaxis protein
MAAAHQPGKRILLIDDDFSTGELTSILLAADGYRVAVARNGAEALERLHDGEPPDLILLDLNMPVMDGCTFCRQLRDGGLARVPVVVLSGLPDAADQAAVVGAAACLAKPVDNITLLTTLRQCCAGAAGALAAT